MDSVLKGRWDVVDDELFEKASKVNCNSQLYKQAGNSVTVNVTNVIAEKIGENV